MLIACLAVFAVSACSAPAATRYDFEIVNAYPHDPGAFTQGLIWHEDRLFESTGLYGQSTVREVDLATGSILRMARLPDDVFGEGLTIWNDRLIVLTWQSRIGYVYDLRSLGAVQPFSTRVRGGV